VRHRTFSINEYSTRYTEAIDKTAEIGDRGWRIQSSSNKQGSSDAVVTEWPDGWVFQKTQSGSGTPPNDWELWDLTGEHAVLVCAELPEGLTPGQYLSLRESDIQAESRLTYEERLKFRVAKEVARKDLVLCTFTRLYWKGNLHNFMHYLGLRREGHAQKEIRDIADAMYELVLPYFPEALNAWNEWRFMGASFGACEMAAIKAMLAEVSDLLPEYKWLTEQLCEHYSTTWTKIHGTAATKRQITEFRDKLGL
jgi:thymidylate synthase (FAD)